MANLDNSWQRQRMRQFPMWDRSGQPGQFVTEEKNGTIHEAEEKWPTWTIHGRGKEWDNSRGGREVANLDNSCQRQRMGQFTRRERSGQPGQFVTEERGLAKLSCEQWY